jgi:protein TonB
MLNVLLESRAPRTRRVGGTMASTLVHAAIVSGAIALTVPGPHLATAAPTEVPIPVFRPPPGPPVPSHGPLHPRPADTWTARRPVIPAIDHVPPEIPPIDPGQVVTARQFDDDLGRGIGSGSTSGSPVGLGGPTGGPIDQRDVDRPPRLVSGSPEPHFPDALRARNQTGRVVVQFVVDTLGRAEQRDVKIVEATDPAFVDAVRAVLPRYRFTPGEAGGRRVRTLVQLPFDFALR